MVRIFPFQALLPEPSCVKQVSAVPYDVIDRDEAKALAADNELSFLRVSRPELELPESVLFSADEVYDRAAANFTRIKREAPLRRDDTARFYVYNIEARGHSQTGLVAAASVDDYDADVIKKHERTRADKEDDRTRHLLATRTHSGPVFLLYRSRGDIDRILTAVSRTEPHFDFVAEDGSRHRIWRCQPELSASLAAAFSQLDALYVADGHHRAKSASRAREVCRKQNPHHAGDEPYNRFLAVMFPHNQLRILPYNRVVLDLNGWPPDAFLRRVSELFTTWKSAAPEPAGPGWTNMYLGGEWYSLRLTENPAAACRPEDLDVSILQNRLLGPVLAIDDPRTSKRIDFVGGIHGPGRLQQQVDSGRGAVAFSLYPVQVQQLIAISDAGACMPPKSTWFEPKLRDGLLIHEF